MKGQKRLVSLRTKKVNGGFLEVLKGKIGLKFEKKNDTENFRIFEKKNSDFKNPAVHSCMEPMLS